MIDYQTARFVLNDQDKPQKSASDFIINSPKPNPTMRLEMLGFQLQQNPFQFSFRDVMDPTNSYVDANFQALQENGQNLTYLNFTLPSQNIYGLGDNTQSYNLPEGVWSLESSNQNDQQSQSNKYTIDQNVHPFIMVQSGKRKDDYFGIFFSNTKSQKSIISYQQNGSCIFTYETTASDLEIYFFMHGSQKYVISLYQSFIGLPQLPPFWSLGWQSSFQYMSNQQQIKDSLELQNKNKVPIDAIYIDSRINRQKNFQINQVDFPNLKDLQEKLRDQYIKTIIIVDDTMIADITDPLYKQLLDSNSIKHLRQDKKEIKNETLICLDWFNDNITNIWEQGLYKLYSQIHYDGILLESSCYSKIKFLNQSDSIKVANTQSDKSESLFLQNEQQFQTETKIRILTESHIQTERESLLDLTEDLPLQNIEQNDQLDSDSIRSHMMVQRTSQYFNSHNIKRPFILSKNTFASTGKFSSQLQQNDLKNWDHLRYSIRTLLNMNIFGIPHSGINVCDFMLQNSDEELCLRWIQLGTFFPLARFSQNVNLSGTSQDQIVIPSQYKDDALASIQNRYSYLRAIYTCLYEINLKGGTCFDPLSFHYPNDLETYQDSESSFIVANNLKVSPILESLEDDKTYFSYFPKGKWVNLADLNEIIDTTKGGDFVSLSVKSTINVHLIDGGLIPFQNTTETPVFNTIDLQNRPISIIANRDHQGHAEGALFLDTGDMRFELESRTYEYYKIRLQANSFSFRIDQIVSYLQGIHPETLEKLIIVDAKDLNLTDFACGMDKNMNKFMNFKINYIEQTQVLEIIPERSIKFSELYNVYFGSSQDNDINLCDPKTFEYNLKENLNLIDLEQSVVDLTLQNVAGTSPDLQMKIQFIDRDIINVKWTYDGIITPAGKRTPVEVPNELVDTSVKQDYNTSSQKLSDFIVITNDPIFSLQFLSRNKSDTIPYFTIKGMLLDSYLNWINVEVTVPSTEKKRDFKGIYGLGERANKQFFYQDGIYTIWGKDQSTPDEDGKPPAKSMYGAQPLFMFRHGFESHVGVFYKLAHAQDWIIKNDVNSGVINLKTIATGGLGDITVMTDQRSPQDIIDRYYTLIGDPVLIPSWALGWNQCRWGYQNVSELQSSVANYNKYDLPLDVQWADIDYMSDYKDFTFDEIAFKELPEFVEYLHSINKRFVPIIDIGISMRPNQNYSVYDEGIEQNVFIKINSSTEGTQNLIGKVWPNEANYPDFFNPNATTWWHNQLSKLYTMIKFDGIWEDMNEVADFCDGLCYDRQKPENQVKNLLPYTPSGADLEVKTASLDGFHINNYLQLDTHSYTGTLEVKATHEWFRDVKKERTFIIERSAFAGMGKFGSRWLGDNWSVEQHMGYSVTGIMLMNIFGMQLAGVDICGFAGDQPNPELCARWHTVGAFYPFSRNHVAQWKLPQEPWVYQQVDQLTLMYFYTQLFLASQGSSQNYRKAFYNPVFFEFPEDMNTYTDLMNNVMLGEALKLSINSQNTGYNVTSYYFPAGIWCDLHHPGQQCLNSTGTIYDLPSKAYDYGLHLREGNLIPHQNAASLKIMNSVDLQSHPVDFHILGKQLNSTTQDWYSQGVYVNDDGLSLELTNNWNRYDIKVNREYDDDEEIIIRFNHSVIAKNWRNKNDSSCTAVNQNDYINQIFIYNAQSFKKSNVYEVVGIKDEEDDIEQKLGNAYFDEDTDRIIFTRDSGVQICMSSYPKIIFTTVY
eukprot:403352477